MFRMKNLTISMISLCAFAVSVFVFLTSCLGAPPNDLPALNPAAPNATYDVLIPLDANNHTEVNHIVIRGGTQEDIGYALGMIGIEKFGSILIPYDDPVYGMAKEEYIRLHDPVLSERIRGIKRAYGLKEDDYSSDASTLLYVLFFPACSAIYFPPKTTDSGHAIGGKNLDWSLNPDEDELADIASGNFGPLISDKIRNCVNVVELYPDDGYATLTIGGADLMNGAFDGINEKGLAVTSLQDGDTYTDPITSLAGGSTSGLNIMQMIRSILENCATVDDAKEHILVNRISMPFMGQHLLVYDVSGNATIIEFDNTSREAIFVDHMDGDRPVPMTNFAVHMRPDFASLKPDNPKDAHDDYIRINRLRSYIDNHVGLFNKTDAWKALSAVAANASNSVEGALNRGTVRLLYTDVVDLSDLTMTARFYQRDGPVNNPAWNTRELVLSEPITFRLVR